jgi:hypothetical protein
MLHVLHHAGFEAAHLAVWQIEVESRCESSGFWRRMSFFHPVEHSSHFICSRHADQMGVQTGGTNILFSVVQDGGDSLYWI